MHDDAICQANAASNILIIDDTLANLQLLQEILTAQGYVVRPVPDSAFALLSAKKNPPDLILLDIKMPGISGFEVCEQLKANALTREIPVIFISALHDVVEKVKAFSLGAVDYITKPFQAEEVVARVGTHLTLRNLQKCLHENNLRLQQEIGERKRTEDALQALNARLEQRVSERTQQFQDANHELQEALDALSKTQEQLVQSEKMALLMALVSGIAHEINTPVGLAFTAVSHVEQCLKEFRAQYQAGQLKRSDLENFLNTTTEAVQIMVNNIRVAAERTQSFKEIAVDQSSGEKRLFNLKNYLDDVLLSLRPKLKKTTHTVTVNCPPDIDIESYPGAFSQIISNLVLNSLMHGFERREHGEILCEVRYLDGVLAITYRDNGKGMEDAHRVKVFDAFFTTKRDQGGSGLGMNIVYNLVTRKLLGQIACESTPELGTIFTIQVPVKMIPSIESRCREGVRESSADMPMENAPENPDRVGMEKI